MVNNMKKVLFICPSFFEYHKMIKQKIMECGYDVDYFDDRPRMGTIYKGLLRVNKNILKKKIEKYFNEILKKTTNVSYEKVIVILGQSFNDTHFLKLKSVHPESEFIYYTWDAITNFPNTLESSKIFDRAYSFDPNDCDKYDHLKYLPLFYSKKYDDVEEVEKNDKVLIFTTIKKGKLRQIEQIESDISKYKKVDKRLFLQSKLVFWYYKLFDADFKKYRMKDFVYTRTNYSDACKLMKEYSYIVDVPMNNQNGLTIRTMESIEFRTKLITTNKNIVESDLYNSSNVIIYPNIEEDFFKGKFKIVDNEKYYINNFVKILLGI